MHFSAHEICTGKHYAYAQGIGGIAFSELLNHLRTGFDTLHPNGRESQPLGHNLTDEDFLLVSGTAARLAAIQRAAYQPQGDAELAYSAVTPEHLHSCVNRAEIKVTRLLLQVFPPATKANTRKMAVCLNHGFELNHFACSLGTRCITHGRVRSGEPDSAESEA
jgi:hypothetical protein